MVIYAKIFYIFSFVYIRVRTWYTIMVIKSFHQLTQTPPGGSTSLPITNGLATIRRAVTSVLYEVRKHSCYYSQSW